MPTFEEAYELTASIATVYAFLGELHTASHRASALAYGSAFIACSLFIMPGMAWLILPGTWSLHVSGRLSIVPWRVFMWSWCFWGALGALGLSILPESPRYLLATKGPNAVLPVLAKITNAFYVWMPHIVNELLSSNVTTSMCNIMDMKYANKPEKPETHKCEDPVIDSRMYPISMFMGILTAIIYRRRHELTLYCVLFLFGEMPKHSRSNRCHSVEDDVDCVFMTASFGDRLRDVVRYVRAAPAAQNHSIRQDCTMTEDRKTEATPFEDALDKTGNGVYNILLVLVCAWILLAIGIDLFGFSLSCVLRVRSKYMLLMTCLLLLAPAAAAAELTWLGVVFRPWRLLIVVLAVPSGIGGIAIYFFHESPKFLANCGRKEEALDVKSLDVGEETSKRDMSLLRSINNSFLVWLPQIFSLVMLSMESGHDEGNICSLIARKTIVNNLTEVQFSNSTASPDSCLGVIEDNVILTLIASQSAFSFLNFIISYLPNHRRVVLLTILSLSSASGICCNLMPEPVASVFFFVVFTCTCLGMDIINTNLNFGGNACSSSRINSTFPFNEAAPGDVQHSVNNPNILVLA
ncbi:hypothetical protein MSG28_008311 [Choristoneura fumiferana]|uniref:Uncharacterized protein n=2 Tax=Choristoneura fumiferana TaxID=7141 RepID=A0ACC0JB08_CHOFU|nr:hypothetical protein MSG28_008311 [Choristoneura fumiferana]